jgi:hypothetical protein
MADTFDPFDLPSSFDPLSYEGPPPPRRQRRSGAEATVTTAEPAHHPTNPRLAHLLPKAKPPALLRPSRTGTDGAAAVGTATDIGARLAALEDEVAILEARLTSLEPLLAHKQAVHQDRLLEAVAKLIDGRLGRR